MKKIRKIKWKLILLTIFSLFILWINYVYVSYSSSGLIFDNKNDIPKFEYALFLGTPKYLSDGSVNNYYKNRINTTVNLYLERKINKIVISADSLNKYKENEVELIKLDLIQEGINESNLILDKDGNRTWKSITNLKKYNNIGKIILISQKFHLERAIYISKRKNIDAIGFEAKGKMSNKLWIREILARVKMQIDLISN